MSTSKPAHGAAGRSSGRVRHVGAPRSGVIAWTLLLATATPACTPTLNWRETAAPDSGIVATFPCKPDRHSRNVSVAGAPVRMDMLVCSAGGATYALSFFDAADPAATATGLADLRAGMLKNIGAGAPAKERPVSVPGLAPGATATRLTADGRRPDGGELRLEAAFFAQGRRVYQAAVVGPPLRGDAIDPFFEGLKLPP